MFKKTLVIVAITALAGLSIASVSKVYAQESSTNVPWGMQGIAKKFNLDENEVAQYMQEQRAARQQQMRTNMEEKLNEAVESGKLTQEQKTKLLDKIEEHEQERQSHRTEMQAWAEENGIDMQELGLCRQGGGRGYNRNRLAE